MTLGFPGPFDAMKAASCDTRRISPVMARDGIIGAQHPLVSSAGLRVLATGGNAVDAAVAAALVGTVVMPGRCGIGGDLFAIVASPDSAGGSKGERLAFHGSGIAPRGASLEFMREHGQDAPDGRRVMAQRGPLSPSVPGFVDGCFALLERFGTRPFAELAAPAMAYAADGFPISPAEANSIAASSELLQRFPTSAAVFLPDGAAPHSGQILRQPELARSLSLIASGGPDVFYRGEIARSIASFLAANGGALTEDDFADHATAVSPPLTTTYRGHTIYETGLPTQGFVVLEALNICEQAPIAEMGLTSARRRPHRGLGAGSRLRRSPGLRRRPELRRYTAGDAPVEGVGGGAICHDRFPIRVDDRCWGDRRWGHHLALRHRRGRADDLAHLHRLRELRFRRRRRRHRHPAHQSRRALLRAGRWPPQHLRARQADDAHPQLLPDRRPGRQPGPRLAAPLVATTSRSGTSRPSPG